MTTTSSPPAPSSVPSPPPAWAPPRTSGFAYQPPLDGLRAFAVLAAMLYHGGVTWMRGGFYGVDTFFVLSGYLITSLLLAEHERKGTIALGAFWARRARRLLPALFLVLGVVALYALFVAGMEELDRIRGDGLATLFYFANWRFIVEDASYFDAFLTPSPLRHAWSLAIEEQWYVVWPLLLPVIIRFTRARLGRILAVILVLAGISSLLMVALYQPGTDPSRVYYGTDTRAQALLIGAALAVVMLWRPHPRRRESRVLLRFAGLAAAAYIGWQYVTVRDVSDGVYQGGMTVFAVAVAVLIASAVQPTRSLPRVVLSWTPIRWIGWISYGLYLWHWPVYVYLSPERTGLEDPALMTVRIAATFAVATVSFYLVEQPIRRGAITGVRIRTALPAAIAAVAVALVLATSVSILPGRFSETAQANPSERFGAEAREEYQEQQEAIAARDNTQTALLVGDSVALTLGLNYDTSLGAPNMAVPTEARLGCGVVRGEIYSDGAYRAVDPICDEWPRLWQEAVAANDPDVVVLLVGGWEVFDRRFDGQHLEWGTPDFEAHFRAEFELAMSILAADGRPVVVLTPPCYTPTESIFGWGSERGEPGRMDWVTDRLRQFADDAAETADVRVLDLRAEVCDVEAVEAELGGAELQYDGVHFTDEGARWVWEWLAPRVANIAVQAVLTAQDPITADLGAASG